MDGAARNVGLMEPEPERMGAVPPRAVELLLDLPDELIERVLEHLSSPRDLGCAGCVCRAWRAGDSPIVRVLRQRIEARGSAVHAEEVAASMASRLCLLDSIGAAQAVLGVMGTGGSANAAVDAQGSLWVWGELRSSVTGAAPIFRSRVPTVIQTPRIERVSCGGFAVLVLTNAGEILSFGNGGRGQLGHGDYEDQLVPKVIEALSGTRVVAIAAGNTHSMVLTHEGAVLSFGWGMYGQLGHGEAEYQFEPKLIEALRGVRVVAIEAGTAHSMALTDEGEVLTFGRGAMGCHGHIDQEGQLVPKVIEALSGVRVVAMAAGSYHSMVLTDEGAVLSFGAGRYGLLGHGDEKNQLEPKMIEALRGLRVVAIAAGGMHSMVLTDEGTVLSFGWDNYGQLGHGNDEDCQLVPRVIMALRGVRVLAITACSHHSMVLTEEGEVLSFGLGRYGHLGHGDAENQRVPKGIAGLTELAGM